MKILTLRQPWAWMVVHGGKRIENRAWQPWEKVWISRGGNGRLDRIPWRGEFLIHAASGCSESEYQNALDFAYGVPPSDRTFAIPNVETLDGPWERFIPPLEKLERGGIIGVAELVDVLPKLPEETELGWSHSWRFPGQLGWVLANVRALAFVPCKGAQGLRASNYDVWQPEGSEPIARYAPDHYP